MPIQFLIIDDIIFCASYNSGRKQQWQQTYVDDAGKQVQVRVFHVNKSEFWIL